MIKKYKGLKLIILLLMVVLLGACSKVEVGSSIYTYNYDGYSEHKFTSDDLLAFGFKYPDGWTVKEESFREAAEEMEASPDWGAVIYKEGYEDNKVYVFDSFSPSSMTADMKKSEFVVDGVKKGDLYTEIGEGKVSLYILYGEKSDIGFQNASVNMEEDFYNEHKEEVWHILASVEY